MKKNRNLFNFAIIIIIALAFAFSIITAFYNLVVSIIELAVTILVFLWVVIYSKLAKRDAYGLLNYLTSSLSSQDKEALQSLPLPVCIVNGKNEFIWYNQKFSWDVMSGKNCLGALTNDYFKYEDSEKNLISYEDKRYTAYISKINHGSEVFEIYYLVNDTDLKNDSEQFRLTRPCVAHILIDNYEELMARADGTQKNFIVSRIESILEKTFVNECNGFFRKLEKDRFIAIIDKQHLDKLRDGKFEILEKIHKSTVVEHMSATLSFGIGVCDDGLHECDLMARQSLDMALGRGGDQIAIKTENGFEFFGGLSKGVEKRAKVRSRMIASALYELVGECENIVIMGHRLADFDSVGAACGLCKIIRSVGKQANICLDKEANLSRELVSYLCENGYESLIISHERALEITSSKTLLIVVDTHNPAIVECPELLTKAKSIVVIDHHRKMVNHIDNAVIFYHEPNASSTCEMVSELVQYFSDGVGVSKTEAEALLAGIMLDTKNFIIKSGVRTFEAAAYLRRVGADLLKVSGWFSSSIETYHQRAKLIASAQIVKKCAISYQDEYSPDLLLAVPQTADELLHIQNVSASFVMYLKDGKVSISARSYGAINVQLIMEKLGGGGHLTMAGAQMEAENCEQVKEKLLTAIDEYYEENSLTNTELKG